jgi:Outer membrane protein beta-barrel domain
MQRIFATIGASLIVFMFVLLSVFLFPLQIHAQTSIDPSSTIPPTPAQLSGKWDHQVGIEIGPQYVFNNETSGENSQRRILQDVGVGIGAAVNYYYRFNRNLFLSVSGVIAYFANGYFRRIDADGTLPLLNTNYFNTANPLVNLALTAGLRYNFALSGLQPYVGLEAGTYSIGGISITDSDRNAGVSPNIAITPKLGVRYPLAPGFDFDASTKLMYLVSGYVPFSYLSLNVGVSYALNFTLE